MEVLITLQVALNMVTEKNRNLKKALFPFFNFLILDQKILLNINNDLNLNFDLQKQFKNIIKFK